MKRVVVVCVFVISVTLGLPPQNSQSWHDGFKMETVNEKKILFSDNIKGLNQKQSVAGESRIVGGQDAQVGDYPFQVSISQQEFQEMSHYCGGAIVDVAHVVTAAQCVSSERPENLRVLAGVTNLADDSGTQQLMSVKDILVHPEYVDGEYNYDIAILELETGFNFNANVNRILLAHEAEPIVNSCVTLGWGATEEDGEPSQNLQVIDVAVVDDETCATDYTGLFTIDYETQICAASLDEGKDFCQGDEGGAMACSGTLYGLASIGVGCARGYPGVYTQIYYFREWILSNIF